MTPPKTEALFPVMLRLRGRPCLVVGGRSLAAERATEMAAHGAEVTVVAPTPCAAIIALAQEGRVVLAQRDYRPGEAADYFIIFVATDSVAQNQRVYDDAERAQRFCNVVDQPERCNLYLPGRIMRGDLTLSISSGGKAPFAVKRLRERLAESFSSDWAPWLDAAASLRAQLRERRLSVAERDRCYDAFLSATVDSPPWRVRLPSAEELASWTAATPAAGTGGSRRPGTVGYVSLVGAGPGDPALLTLRAHQRLHAADAVVYDRLAAPALPCTLPAHVMLFPVGKTAGHHPTPQDEINALLVDLARQGKHVVRFKGGDPLIFGRGGEELEVLRAANVPYEVVPGLTAGLAAAAYAGVPATHRQHSAQVTLLTAHKPVRAAELRPRLDLLAQDPHATLVGYMAHSSLADTMSALIAAGIDPHTPALVIERGCTSAQRTVVSTVHALAPAVAKAGLQAPVVFVVGPTVALAPQLDWTAARPLARERLLTFAADDHWQAALDLAGAELVIVAWPLTAVAQIVIAALPISGCLLRSTRDVDAMDSLHRHISWRDHPTAWCLGPKTATHARQHAFWRVIELPAHVSAEQLVAELRRHRPL